MRFFETTILYLQNQINDLTLLKVDYEVTKIADLYDSFDVLYAFSVDGVNYSNWKDQVTLAIDIPGQITEYFIAIKLQKLHTQTNYSTQIYLRDNVYKEIHDILIKKISYNGKDICLEDRNQLQIKSFNEIINQYPKWNLYDNQQHNIQRWVAQCNAVAEMYGHMCIYFKTTPIETNHTFRHNYKREVEAVKKIPILFPGNEIGDPDKMIYSEWDLPLADDFISHIVWDKFKAAFGDEAIPNDKDYIYLPLLNKMFRVGLVQPVNKFMGKVAWWEVNLVKFEEDNSIGISEGLKNDLMGIPGFDAFLDGVNVGELLDISGTDLLPQFPGQTSLDQKEAHVDYSLNTAEKIGEKTVLEKRKATESYTNKLVDSTGYISLKESEKFRQFFNQRLSIVQVNPDSQAYPVNMYDNSKIESNVLALQYKLSDFTEVSRVSTIVNTYYNLQFDIVFLSKFRGDLFSIIGIDETLIYHTYSSIRNPINLQFSDNLNDECFKQFDYVFEEKELYSVDITYTKIPRQTSIKIFQLKDKVRTIVFQDIYIMSDSNTHIQIGYLQLYGGRFLSSNISLTIDDKNIFNDKCNPLLVMNQIK